jgi:hypothetical protein
MTWLIPLYSTKEIFDIIVDFPDSRLALDDLKVRLLSKILNETTKETHRRVYSVSIIVPLSYKVSEKREYTSYEAVCC